jgi:hypothetical protein
MSVQIAARALLAKRQASLGLVGSVFRRDGKHRDQFVTDIRVPMVDYASDFTQQKLEGLEAGKYLIQVSLPNGGIITQQFEIRAGENTKLIIDVPHEGPHEWSSLQAMTGQFAAEAAETQRFARGLTDNPLSYTQLMADPENGYALAFLAPGNNPSGNIFAPGQTMDRLSQVISSNLDVSMARKELGPMQTLDHPSLEDNDFAIFRFVHSGLLEGENTDDEHFDMGPGSGVGRHYLVQQSRQGAHLICVPTPWMTPGGQVETELLVKKHSLESELDYSMTIADPMVNTALGYINMGAVHLAERLIGSEHAMDMLYRKVSYPLAATIGGYILVLSQNTKRFRSDSENWKNWVSNLDGWFEWLPDGAILNAAMRRMEKGADLDEAYKALMRGYDRGLPFFTFGLKQLIDGMRFFAGKGEKAAKQRLELLEPIASRADPSIPFLSVNFSNTWEQTEPSVAMEMTYA